MPDVQPFAVAPERAIAALATKLAIPSESWADLWQGMHAAAFVVAGATKQAVVEDFHEAVTRAIDEGRTLEQFRGDFDRIVAEHGWSYRGSRGWRSRVIYQTNMRTAHAAGEWAGIQDTKKLLPYLRYVTMDDPRVRPEHAAWHNVVLPVDHPWWETHYPPNGWGCRCRVEALSERMLKRLGLKVTDPVPDIEMEKRVIGQGADAVELWVPKGIDPGWAYNPGIASYGRGAVLAAGETEGFEELQAPGTPAPLPPLSIEPPAAAPFPRPESWAEARARLVEVLGGEQRVFADPTGQRVVVDAGIVDHAQAKQAAQIGEHLGRARYFSLLPDLIENPAEIWVGFAAGKATGKAALRRRYVKVVDVGNGTYITLVADRAGALWLGLTAFYGKLKRTDAMRTGRLVYRR